MDSVLHCVVLCSILLGCSGFQWSPSGLQEDAIVYACQNGNITLDWNVTMTRWETITNIQWFYRGRSEELIATWSNVSNGQLDITPTFSGRVEMLANAGLNISHVTDGEDGNYSVIVKGLGSGYPENITSTAIVQVGNSLRTTDGHLHAYQSPEAAFNTSTHRWHAVLTCGNFTYPTRPPFDVEWTIPSGQVVLSTQFKDGHFLLLLDNPVSGGSYTCNIPQESTSTACLHGNNAHRGEASVTVDRVEARLVVLEAELAQERQNAEDERISFHATGLTKQTPAAAAVLIFPNVVTNLGDAYNASSGKFMAPKNGTYGFFATIGGWADASHSINLDLLVDGTEVDGVKMTVNHDVQSGAAHGVVRLREGQKVWMRNIGTGNHFWTYTTAFSGFLITLDP